MYLTADASRHPSFPVFRSPDPALSPSASQSLLRGYNIIPEESPAFAYQYIKNIFGPAFDPYGMLESKAQLDHMDIWLQIPNIGEPGVRKLFETFWTTAHICFPILDEAALRKLYATLPPAAQLRVDRSNCALAAIIFSVLALSALYQRTKAEAEYYYWWATCMAKLDAGKYELEMVMVNILKASELALYEIRKLTCRPAIALISRVQVNAHITRSLTVRHAGVDLFRFVFCRPE